MAVAPAVALALDDQDGSPPASPEAVPLVGLRRSSRFVPELESVRGIAVLLVFAFHVDGYVRYPFTVQPGTPLALAFVRAGHTGVDLFFVLSGFLLSLPFLTDGAGGRRVVIREYFMRRALRILPLYWVAVLVGTALSAAHIGDLRHALPYLAFLNGFPRMCVHLDPYSGVWWSLATEAQFYLVLPLLPLVLRSRRGRWAGAAVLSAYALVYAAVVRGDLRMGSIEGQLALHNSVFGRGPLFLWGLLAAATYHRLGDRLCKRLDAVRWLRNGGADLLMLVLIVGNALFLQWLVSIGPVRQMGAADQPWHIVNGGLWAAFILLVLLAPLRTKRLFSNAALGGLGILSYSIYMIHAPFIMQSLWAIRRVWPQRFDEWSLPTAAVIAGLSVACLGLSALTYRFVERPFLLRKGRLDS